MASLIGWLNETGNRRGGGSRGPRPRGAKTWPGRSTPHRGADPAPVPPACPPGGAGRKGGATNERKDAPDLVATGQEARDELLNRLLDPTLTLEQAAQVLNVCPTTVRRYTNRGDLPHFRTAGNQRRFRLSDVLAFLRSQGGAAGVDGGLVQ